jgi:uncharacterized RDD family membrane protein YckC
LKPKPSFFRYLAIIVYDTLLLSGVLFFATLLILPFNAGIAFSREQFLYPAYLVFVSFLFYGWFWTHGGQTLGLRAWKIRVLNDNYEPITWRQAFVRFIVSLFSWGVLGLGFLWVLVDKNQRSWHDMASQTGLYLESTNNKETIMKP